MGINTKSIAPSPGQLWKDPSGRLVRVVNCGSLIVYFEFVRGKNGRKGRKASMFIDSFGRRFKYERQMTNDEIRIAIAESVGTLSTFYCPTHRETVPDYNRREKDGKWICNGCGSELHHDSPNYPEDLNAMHEVEKTILPQNRKDYMDKLDEIVPFINSSGQRDYSDWALCCATARQRAEAYLRVKGLWKE